MGEAISFDGKLQQDNFSKGYEKKPQQIRLFDGSNGCFTINMFFVYVSWWVTNFGGQTETLDIGNLFIANIIA